MRVLSCVIGFLLSTPAAAQPTISAVLNGASYDAGAAPGSIISIFGAGLASQTVQAANVPLPTTLGGTSVTISGQGSIPLYFVSSTQINAVVPFQAPVYTGPGAAPTVTVTTSAGTSQPFNLEVRPAVPGLFTTSGNGQGQALIFNPDFSAATQLVPGQSYIVYATGLGGVQPVPLPGAGGATAEPLNRVVAPTQILVGETAITPDFSGISPGLVNVYQVNFTVPADFVPASDRIFVQAQGWQSNAASFQVPPSNLVAQGTIQALYPYAPPGGGMMSPVTFGLLLEAGAFTVQVTVPTASNGNSQLVRVAAVTDAGSTVVQLDSNGVTGGGCGAAQTGVTSAERAGNFSYLLPSTRILDFAAGPSLLPFPNNEIPLSRLDPVWVNVMGKIPLAGNALAAPNLNGSVQATCSMAGNIFSVNSTTNQSLSTFGGLRMLPYAPFGTRTSTFKLYVNGVVIAQEQVQYPTLPLTQ